MTFTEFTTIRNVRIEVQDRAGLQVVVDLDMHKETKASGVQQMPLFGELAFGYEGKPIGPVIAALFKTCSVSRMADLTGRPLVVEYGKDPRAGLPGDRIPHAVAFSDVGGETRTAIADLFAEPA